MTLRLLPPQKQLGLYLHLCLFLYLHLHLHLHLYLYLYSYSFSYSYASAMLLIIGPESDHWLCLSLTDSLTDSLTNCRLVNLIDVSLACEHGNSKLVEADDDDDQLISQ